MRTNNNSLKGPRDHFRFYSFGHQHKRSGAEESEYVGKVAKRGRERRAAGSFLLLVECVLVF